MSLSLIESLPDELILLIFDLLHDSNDQTQFALINRTFCQKYLKQFRSLVISGEKYEKFLTSEAFRSHVLSMIKDPYKQLSLSQDKSTTLTQWVDSPSSHQVLSLRRLCCALEKCVEAFCTRVDKIEVLELNRECQDFEDVDCQTSMNDLMIQLNEKKVIIQHLFINKYIVLRDVPVLPSLESISIWENRFIDVDNLHVSEYKTLHCVSLYLCEGVSDVSALEGISHVEIAHCPHISDISCLNHNNIVSIWNCKGVRDYSKSFQFSEFIQIAYPAEEASLTIDVQRFEAVTSLHLEGLAGLRMDANNVIQLPNINKLRECSITSFPFPFTLSENNLREITISDCPKFLSLASISHIPHITLKQLPITTLEELRGGIRKAAFTTINIDTCHEITDYSPLSSFHSILIKHSNGFKDSSSLTVVPVVEFRCFELEAPVNAQAVTHLWLEFLKPSIARKIESLDNLRELTIQNYFKYYDSSLDDIFIFLRRCPVIKKVCIGNLGTDAANDNTLYAQLLQNASLEGFLIQTDNLSRDIVLLKI